MRPIKFRAWDKDNKRMFAVPALSFGDDGAALTTTIRLQDQSGYIRILVVGENADLMQFTGIVDKDGKEIYEGDIVEWSIWPDTERTDVKRLRDQVIWGAGQFATARQHRLLFSIESYRKVAVIGNIYESPDLLKAETP